MLSKCLHILLPSLSDNLSLTSYKQHKTYGEYFSTGLPQYNKLVQLARMKLNIILANT